MDMVTSKMIVEARDRIRKQTLRTPLVPLNADHPGTESVLLKLENLQPTGSFKVRGACNAIALSMSDAKRHGVYTVSAGNMAQALAWQAKQNGIKCSVIVPDDAPQAKLEGIRRYDAKIIPLSFDRIWDVVSTHQYEPLEREGSVFIHPFADARMIAGNGTIGLEILEDLPDVDSVIVPFGGGGLSAGIATGVKSLKPSVRVYGCEPETAAPLALSFSKGSPQEVRRTPSFVDGIGGKSVLPEMWRIIRPLLDGSIVVSLKETAEAVRLLMVRNRIVAEGAGGASVAAALTGKAGSGNIVCIVSGGNIDPARLVSILEGKIP